MQMYNSWALVKYLATIPLFATFNESIKEFVLYIGMAPAANNAFTAYKLSALVAKNNGVLPPYICY